MPVPVNAAVHWKYKVGLPEIELLYFLSVRDASFPSVGAMGAISLHNKKEEGSTDPSSDYFIPDGNALVQCTLGFRPNTKKTAL